MHASDWFKVFGFVVFFVFVVTPAVVVARQILRARRANQVVPGRPTGAPLWWLWLPSPAALLHRRLRAAMASARFGVSGCGPGPIAPLASALDELASVATHLDDGVVAAARLPRGARRRALRELGREVQIVERTADQVVRTASRFLADDSAIPSARLAAVRERLEAVDLAFEEVRQIESHH